MVHLVKSYEGFEKHLAGARNKLVIIYFTAKSCGVCKSMDPEVKALAASNAPDVVFLNVDVDKLPYIAEYYKINGWPAFIFLRDRKKIAGFIGDDDYKLIRFLHKFKNPSTSDALKFS